MRRILGIVIAAALIWGLLELRERLADMVLAPDLRSVVGWALWVVLAGLGVYALVELWALLTRR